MHVHLECMAGASGDMILGALLDAGADLSYVQKQVGLAGDVELTVERAQKNGIRALAVMVEGSAGISSYAEIEPILDRLDEDVRTVSSSILRRLAEAEGHVHGTTHGPHFHEIDGADTLADSIGTAAALVSLEIDEVSVSNVATGMGFVKTAHGELPLPAPAASRLLEGFTIFGRETDAELITPTGAAILSTLASHSSPMPSINLKIVGCGAGSLDLSFPNILRAFVGTAHSERPEGSRDVVVEANIDDMNPEFYGYVTERLYAAGAADVWITPGIGKGGRPLSVIGVIAVSGIVGPIKDVLLRETSTIGVRTTAVERFMLDRSWVEVLVRGYPVRVKVAKHEGLVTNLAPEYSDCVEVAKQTGLPLKQIFAEASAAARQPGQT